MQEVKAIQLSPGDTIYVVNFERGKIEEVILGESNFIHSREAYSMTTFDVSGLVELDENGAIKYFDVFGENRVVSQPIESRTYIHESDAQRMLQLCKEFSNMMTLDNLARSFVVQIKKDNKWVTEYEFTTHRYIENIPYFDKHRFLEVIKNHDEYRVYARFSNTHYPSVHVEILPNSDSDFTSVLTSLSLHMQVCEPQETSSIARQEVRELISVTNDDKFDSEVGSTSAKIDLLSDDNGQISATASNVLSEPNNTSLPPIELPIYK